MDIELEKLKKLEEALSDCVDILRDCQLEEALSDCVDILRDCQVDKTCDNCKHSDLPRGYEPCVYCRNKDDWEPKESPCPCEDAIDFKACAGCPQDELRKQTFRPFKDCDELVKFWSKNYQTGFRPTNTKPLIWVRLKCDGRERLIVAFGDNFVEIGNKAKTVTLQHLFEQYEFLDGKPCGMEVKE